MKAYFLAEKLKYKRTALPFVIVLMPLATALLAALLTREYFAMDSYNWWYITMFPGTTAIICGMIGGKDFRQKNRTIWPLPVNLRKIWDAKLLWAGSLTGISMCVLTVTAILAGCFMENVLQVSFIHAPSFGMQILAAIVIWFTSLWQIPICLYLSQKMGVFAMFLLHLGSYMAVAVTASLHSWFVLFPGAITSRLMCVFLQTLPNGLPAEAGQMTWTSELMNSAGVFMGLLAATAWFLLCWIVSRSWFERQVGRQ